MTSSTIEATLSERESLLARESERALTALLSEHSTQSESISLHIGSGEESRKSVALPASVLPLLNQLLAEMARGNAVALVPVERELSTFQAADILNVSRPYLIKLLETGEIPFRRVGTHRRVLFRDLLEYKRADDAKREAILGELVAEAQEMDMGY